MHLFRFIRNTGIWAPITVLILHQVLHSKEWHDPIDWFNHFSGGLSFSYFTWKSLPYITRWSGPLTPLGRLATAFLSGCTAALLWEIGEFLSDTFLHTRIQHDVRETMTDIVNGLLGTSATVLVLLLLNPRLRPSTPRL